MEARDISLEDIQVGDTATFERTITTEDIAAFASLSGDANPLHTDEAYAKKTQFGRPLVHGMLLGAFCSALVGMYLPGRRCLDLRQDLSFKKPVFAGDTVWVTGTVVTKSNSTRILTLNTTIAKDGGEVVIGTATVQVLT